MIAAARGVLRGLVAVLCAAALGAAVPAAAQEGELDSMEQRVKPCVACHGEQGRASAAGFLPRIAGKPEGYLYNQLLNFREGRRRHDLMTYLVERQTDAYLLAMAAYFAAQHPPYPPPEVIERSDTLLQRGEQLVREGDAALEVPACIACHGTRMTGIAPAIPGLIGLPRDYLSAQLGAWRGQTRHAQAPDCMAQIARRLSLRDLEAVTAWLAAQPVPDNAQPQPALLTRLPMDCGGVPQVQP